MLDIKMIRENPQLVHDGLLKRNVDVDFTELLSFDSGRRAKIAEVEVMKNDRNVTSKKISVMKKNHEDATEEVARMRELGDRIDVLNGEIRELEEKIRYILDRDTSLDEVYWPCSHSRAIPSFPSQLEWKIGLAWANSRGSLNSPS